MTSRIAAFLFAASIAPSALAQSGAIAIPDAREGERVAVQSPAVLGAKVVGPLLVANQGFVSVAIGDRQNASVSVPWTRITGVSLADGRDKTRSAVRGAVIGLGAALITGGAFHRHDGSAPDHAADAARIATAAALPFAGAIIGWRVSPDQFRPIAWCPSIDTVLPEGEAVRLRLAPDTRVQVRAKGRTTNAQLVSAGDSLVVRQGSKATTYSWFSVTELRIPGRRDRGKGAAIGFTSFALLAAVAGAIHPLPSTSNKAAYFVDWMLVGGVLGAVIGTPGWSRVPIPVQ
ncbi:MAG TPA: hypothetical protein VF483_06950 [Gemmatimonadaceae bacterium]